jgi:hypothetical protein
MSIKFVMSSRESIFSRDPSVRRCICLNSRGLTATSEAAAFLSESHRVTSLSLVNRCDANTLLTAALTGGRNLKQLELRFCQPLTEATVNLLCASSVAGSLVPIL